MPTTRIRPLWRAPSVSLALAKSPARAAFQSLFFYRDADPAKEAAHHRGVGFDPSLGRKPIAESLKRDVRFLGPHGLQKVQCATGYHEGTKSIRRCV
jgi:hypothetical protein